MKRKKPTRVVGVKMERERSTRVVGVRMERDLEKRLDDVSKKFDRTRGAVIRKVLSEYLPRVIKSKSVKSGQKKKSKKKKPDFWRKAWF